MLFIILSAGYLTQAGNFIITPELYLPAFDWFLSMTLLRMNTAYVMDNR